MAKLNIVDMQEQKSSKRQTRAKVLARCEEVAQQRVSGQAALDEAFAALTSLGPDATAQQIQAAQEHLRDLLAAGL